MAPWPPLLVGVEGTNRAVVVAVNCVYTDHENRYQQGRCRQLGEQLLATADCRGTLTRALPSMGVLRPSSAHIRSFISFTVIA